MNKQENRGGESSVVFVNFNTLLLMVGMTYRLRASKDTEDFNNTTNQLNVTGTYKTLKAKRSKRRISRCSLNIL